MVSSEFFHFYAVSFFSALTNNFFKFQYVEFLLKIFFIFEISGPMAKRQ